MHDWPNAPSLDPIDALARDVAATGSLSLTAGALGERFGIQRLTTNARTRIAEELRDARLICTPALADARRTDRLTVTVAPERVAAPAARRRRPVKWLIGVPALLLLLILLAAAAGGGSTGARGASADKTPAAQPRTAPAQTTPAAPAAETVDDTAQVRAQADDMASAGRWVAAVALLHDNDDDTYADKLARRGARRILRAAHRALRQGRYANAKALAARSDRLVVTAAAADVRRSAVGRAAARKKAERLARDRRFCSASEKDTVDYGGTLPAGCGAYARQKRAEEQAFVASEPEQPTAAPDSGSSGDGAGGRGLGCDGDPGATPYPQFPGQRDGDGDGCYGES